MVQVFESEGLSCLNPENYIKASIVIIQYSRLNIFHLSLRLGIQNTHNELKTRFSFGVSPSGHDNRSLAWSTGHTSLLATSLALRYQQEVPQSMPRKPVGVMLKIVVERSVFLPGLEYYLSRKQIISS